MNSARKESAQAPSEPSASPLKASPSPRGPRTPLVESASARRLQPTSARGNSARGNSTSARGNSASSSSVRGNSASASQLPGRGVTVKSPRRLPCSGTRLGIALPVQASPDGGSSVEAPPARNTPGVAVRTLADNGGRAAFAGPGSKTSLRDAIGAHMKQARESGAPIAAPDVNQNSTSKAAFDAALKHAVGLLEKQQQRLRRMGASSPGTADADQAATPQQRAPPAASTQQQRAPQ